MRILDKAGAPMRSTSSGCRERRAALSRRLPSVVRRGAGHRPDRLGQVDHALRRAQRAQHDRQEHHHDRGPGRIPDHRDQPGPGEPKAGLTFARPAGVPAEDPDMIMVGEIRDGETAKIAFRAALTGHLVLSTLHTNDAPSAITRLIDMGIEPFLTSSAVRTPSWPSACPAALPITASTHGAHRRAVRPPGLPRGLRRRGLRAGRMWALRRVGIQGPDRDVRGHAGLGGDPGDLRSTALRPTRSRATAVGQGMRLLREDGFDKVKTGVTSVAEVARVC